MMDPNYLRPGLPFALAHAVEEAGELMGPITSFLVAAGKTQRWGPDSVNPELPPAQQETNRDWLKDEIDQLRRTLRIEVADLEGALNRLEAQL